MQKCANCGNIRFTEVIMTLHSGAVICEDGFVEHDYDSEDVPAHYPEPNYVCEACDTKHQLTEGLLQKADE